MNSQTKTKPATITPLDLASEIKRAQEKVDAEIAARKAREQAEREAKLRGLAD